MSASTAPGSQSIESYLYSRPVVTGTILTTGVCAALYGLYAAAMYTSLSLPTIVLATAIVACATINAIALFAIKRYVDTQLAQKPDQAPTEQADTTTQQVSEVQDRLAACQHKVQTMKDSLEALHKGVEELRASASTKVPAHEAEEPVEEAISFKASLPWPNLRNPTIKVLHRIAEIWGDSFPDPFYGLVYRVLSSQQTMPESSIVGCLGNHGLEARCHRTAIDVASDVYRFGMSNNPPSKPHHGHLLEQFVMAKVSGLPSSTALVNPNVAWLEKYCGYKLPSVITPGPGFYVHIPHEWRQPLPIDQRWVNIQRNGKMVTTAVQIAGVFSATDRMIDSVPWLMLSTALHIATPLKGPVSTADIIAPIQVRVHYGGAGSPNKSIELNDIAPGATSANRWVVNCANLERAALSDTRGAFNPIDTSQTRAIKNPEHSLARFLDRYDQYSFGYDSYQYYAHEHEFVTHLCLLHLVYINDLKRELALGGTLSDASTPQNSNTLIDNWVVNQVIPYLQNSDYIPKDVLDYVLTLPPIKEILAKRSST